MSVSPRPMWCTRWTTALVHWWTSRSGWMTRSLRRSLTSGQSAGESVHVEGSGEWACECLCLYLIMGTRCRVLCVHQFMWSSR